MTDIREEIERLSALLSVRIEHLAKREGRPVHFSSYSVAAGNNRLAQLFSTMLHLPRGYAATFLPRAQLEQDGTWRIDIRRNDGVIRESWFDGIVMGYDGAEPALLYKGRLLQLEDLERIVSDLTKPGLSGMALDINRLYRMYFGRMEQTIMDTLSTIRDVDLLDDVYDALMAGRSRSTIDELIRGQTSANLAAPSTTPPVAQAAVPDTAKSVAAPTGAKDAAPTATPEVTPTAVDAQDTSATTQTPDETTHEQPPA